MKKEKHEGNTWGTAGRWSRYGVRPLLNTSKLEKYNSGGYDILKSLESCYNSSKLKKKKISAVELRLIFQSQMI